MGFEFARLIARVRYGAKPTYPQSHQVLLVSVGQPWLVDVGFDGNDCFPLAVGHESRQLEERFRLFSGESGEYLLQAWIYGEWDSFYSFSTQPCQPVDHQYATISIPIPGILCSCSGGC